MKLTSIITLVIFVLLLSTASFAKIWTVDNNSNSTADYVSIQEAQDNALPGDTIYVHGCGSNDYGEVNIDKQLVLIGTGYFLAENPNTQANTKPANTRTINFNNGSKGSSISGFNIYSDGIGIHADNIVIKRNYIYSRYSGVYIHSGRKNIIITGNYMYRTSNVTTRDVIYIDQDCNNIQINNNCVFNKIYGNSIMAHSTSSIKVYNNVLIHTVEIHNSDFYNNILKEGSFTGTNHSENIHHNIGDADQFGTANGNQANVPISTVFVNSGSTDGQWQLRTGSPAIGAGFNGEDCGMFGGNTPYILSGLPSIPSIYYFCAPSQASSAGGLRIQLKVKSNN